MTYKSAGVTLLELLITVSIIGLLMTLAYSSYQTHLLTTRRLEAQSTLLAIAANLEQYHFLHKAFSYEGATLGQQSKTDVYPSKHTANQFYQLQLTTLTANTFVVSATAQGAQQADSNCWVLQINHLGEQASQTKLGQSSTNCW